MIAYQNQSVLFLLTKFDEIQKNSAASYSYELVYLQK